MMQKYVAEDLKQEEKKLEVEIAIVLQLIYSYWLLHVLLSVFCMNLILFGCATEFQLQGEDDQNL